MKVRIEWIAAATLAFVGTATSTDTLAGLEFAKPAPKKPASQKSAKPKLPTQLPRELKSRPRDLSSGSQTQDETSPPAAVRVVVNEKGSAIEPRPAADGSKDDVEARFELRKEIRKQGPLSTAKAAQETKNEEADSPAGEEASEKFSYDPVASDQADSVAGRLKLVERLIRDYGRAYDYRVHTTQELERILNQLDSRSLKALEQDAIPSETQEAYAKDQADQALVDTESSEGEI